MSQARSEVTITKDQMTPAAQAIVDTELAGKQVVNLRMMKETRDGKTVFNVKGDKSDGKAEVNVAEDGTVLNRDEETPITKDQMSPAAKEALDEKLAGELVTALNVRKEIHEGKPIHEVDYTEDQGQGMLWISQDGKILNQIGEGELGEPAGW